MVNVPLLADTAALVLAPGFAWLLARRASLEAVAQGLTQVVVAGLVLLHVVPFGVASAGWPALLALGAGLGLGMVAHRLPGGESTARGLAGVALVVHGLLDGAAFAGGGEGDELVAWAVVAHSLPVGLATWRVGLASGGARQAAGLLLASVGATWAGWWGADALLAGMPRMILAILQCLVAGSLLHVLTHLGEDDRSPVGSGVGALVGMGLVGALAYGETIPLSSPGALPARSTLTGLVLALAPALLFAWLLGGVGRALGIDGLTARLGQGPPLATTLRRLAGPGVGFAPLLVAASLLGWPFALLRLGSAAVVGLVATPAGLRGPAAPADPPPGGAPGPGFTAAVERTAPWVLAGLAVASFLEPLVDEGLLGAIARPWSVGAAALLGLPAYVCAIGVAPILAVLVHKGLGVGAALAFALTGSATHLGAILAMAGAHGRPVAARFVLGLVGVAVALGLAVDRAVDVVPIAPPGLHDLLLAAPGTLAWPATLVLGVAFAAAVVRRGPAGLLDPLSRPHTSHRHP